MAVNKRDTSALVYDDDFFMEHNGYSHANQQPQKQQPGAQSYQQQTHMQNYFAEIPEIDNFYRVVSDEALPSFDGSGRLDDIFHDNNLSHHYGYSVANDACYSFPDKTQYIFHTTNYSNLVIQYSNNMIVPMRQKSGLRHNFGLQSGIGASTGSNGDGVYIVEYYNISRQFSNTDDFISSLLDYYNMSGNIYPEQLHIKNMVTERLNFLRHYKGASPAFKLRIVTFIPIECILQLGMVYVPTSDIVVGGSAIQPNIVHPSSNIYRQFNRTLESDVRNYIEIDIVDINGNVPHFVNVGNQVMSVLSRQTTNVANRSCTVSVYRDREIVHTQTVPYTRMNDIGIFNNPEEARTSGNLNLINESQRLQNELEKITLDKQKLEHDKAKLKQEKFEMEQDAYRFEKQMELDIEKLRTNLESLEFEKKKLETKNKELDVELQKQKEQYEHNIKLRQIDLDIAQQEKERLLHRIKMEKYGFIIDALKSCIKTKQDEIGHNHDIQKKLVDIEAAKAKYKQEQETLRIKHQHEMQAMEARQREKNVSFAGQTLALATTIAKLL